MWFFKQHQQHIVFVEYRGCRRYHCTSLSMMWIFTAQTHTWVDALYTVETWLTITPITRYGEGTCLAERTKSRSRYHKTADRSTGRHVLEKQNAVWHAKLSRMMAVENYVLLHPTMTQKIGHAKRDLRFPRCYLVAFPEFQRSLIINGIGWKHSQGSSEYGPGYL